jgi:Zn-dependent protease with chaperone function
MTELRGVYFDGVSSQHWDVTVTLDEQGVLHVVGLPAPVAHPLAAVRVDAPLGNTARALWFPDGAKCESRDHTALDELARRQGKGRGGRLVHALESSGRTAFIAVVVLLLLMGVGAKWGIPFAARRIAAAVPPALAYDLGRGTLQALDKIMLKPSQLTDEQKVPLEREFEGMAAHYPDLPLTLTFRRGVGPNAFALPDGTVVATDELVKLAKNNQEVMAVLAHEIGHVHHRHSLRMALESSTVLLLVSTYLGDVTQLTTLSASLPGVYAQAHYSREHETEADTFALEYLDETGIPHHHFADILRSLQKEAGPDDEHGLQYLASHPPTNERIRRFEK